MGRRGRSGDRGDGASGDRLSLGPWPLLLRASRSRQAATKMHGLPQRTKFLLKWCGAMHIVQCSIFRGKLIMADETKVQAEAAAAAPAKAAEAVADTAAKVVKESAVLAKRERAKTARRVKRQAVTQK